MLARALFYTRPRVATLETVDVPFMAEGHVLVRTIWSAISRGTERLVFEGRVPPCENERMRAPFQEGAFPFPVKYGYCAVGTVEKGPAGVEGRTVFALYPHQDRFAVPKGAATLVPSSVPPRRAILAANMETALNAIWDSGASAGDRIAIVGGGAVGLLIASVAARLPATEVTVCDVNPAREKVAVAIGARFALPSELADLEADIVFHTSASAAGIAKSLELAGFEGRVVEVSWYGANAVEVPLGGQFHSKRLQLISSQVGSVSASRRPRWDYARRLRKALELLDDARLDALITDEVAFEDLPKALPAIFDPNSSAIVTAIRY